MAGSVNKVILVGNLGKDPEIRNTQSGSRVANLTLATSETWNDKASGERREKTEWHRIVIFNDRLVDVAERFLKKGAKVYLEGTLQTRKWTDQSGVDKFTTEIVLDQVRGVITMLSGRNDSEGNDGVGHGGDAGGQSGHASGGSTSGGGTRSQRPPARAENHVADEEIPF